VHLVRKSPAPGSAAVNEQTPVPRPVAARAVLRSVARTGVLLLFRRTHLRRGFVGREIGFGDGTSALVYRETVVDSDAADPCVLVVAFRLRLVRGWGHRLFQWESLLNTPLFVGFPGFVSKLWLTHDENGDYRGVYQWDGSARAEHYARCLWRVLALVSVPGSIRYHVIPATQRDQLLSQDVGRSEGPRWWRPRAPIDGTFASPPRSTSSVP
jgi:hypothetical protein